MLISKEKDDEVAWGVNWNSLINLFLLYTYTNLQDYMGLLGHTHKHLREAIG